MKKKVILFLLVFLIKESFAVNINITANTNWSAIVSGSGPGGQPSSADHIFVRGGAVLSLDIAIAEVGDISLASNATVPIGNGTLFFDPGTQLTVTNNINLGDATRTGTIDMTNGGTLIVGSLVKTGTGNTPILIPGTGIIRIGNNTTLPSSTQFAVFNDLFIDGGTTATSRVITINGVFQIAAGATFDKGHTTTVQGDITVFGTWRNIAGNTNANSNFSLENGSLYTTNAGATSTTNLVGNLALKGTLLTRNVTGNGRWIIQGNVDVEAGSNNTNDGGRWEVIGTMTIDGTMNFAIVTVGNFRSIGSLVINNGGVLNFSNDVTNSFNVQGNFDFNGGQITASNISTVNVLGNFNVNSGVNAIAGCNFSVSGTTTVFSGASFDFNNNNGTKSLTNIDIQVGGTFTNSANEAITILGNLNIDGSFTSGTGTYTFSGVGLDVSGISPITIQTISLSIPNTIENFADLTIGTNWAGTGTIVQQTNATLRVSGTISSPTAIIDATTNIPNLVDFNGSGSQTILAGNYYNLTVSNGGTTITSAAFNILNDLRITGGIFTSAHQITGNASGVLEISPGAIFNVGQTTSATAIFFPTNYITANISIASNSTVRYQSNISTQTISSEPSAYGNLEVIQGGGGAKTKTISPAAGIQVAGNLTITSPCVFSIGANNLDLNGNFNGTGALTMGSSTFFIAGNWNNTGTFTAGTGTVNYDGNGSQLIGSQSYFNLTSSASGARTLQGSGIISIAGVFTPGLNVYTITNSTVRFNGSAAQTIPAFAFFNLTTANVAGLALAGDVSIENTLTLSTGNLNTTGFNLTLLSSSTNTARIAPVTSGSLTGNIIQQRFAPGSTTGWAMLGAPMNSTIGQWTDDFPNSGFTGSTGWAGGFVSIQRYQESAPGNWDDPASYLPIASSADALTKGRGYWVYLGTGPITTTDINIDVTGAPHIGNFPFPITYTNNGLPSEDGWNLVANPYPSAIDWDAASGWTRTNVDNAVYIFSADLGQYAAYVAGVGVNGGTRYIASSQGFYIKANAASPVLSATENVKSSQNPALIRASNFSQPDMLRLKVTNAGNGFSDEVAIRFSESSSLGFDVAFDALKLFSPADYVPTLALSSSSEKMMLNTIPAPAGNDFSIPLYFKPSHSGKHTFSFDGASLLSHPCIVLFDKKTGEQHSLEGLSNIEFTADKNDATDRFEIRMSFPSPMSTQAASCSSSHDALISFGENGSTFTNVISDAEGRVISQQAPGASGLVLSNLSSGVYQVEQQSLWCGTSSYIIDLRGSEEIQPVFSLTPLGGGNVKFENLSAEDGSFEWVFGDGQTLVSSEKVVYHQYSGPGKYEVSLIGKKEDCEVILSQNLNLTFSPKEVSVFGSNGEYRLSFAFEAEERVEIHILNSAGQRIRTQSMSLKGAGAELLNLTELPMGVYLLEVRGSDFLSTHRVVR
jgi:fibronectin-binding autotransporter adhesin